MLAISSTKPFPLHKASCHSSGLSSITKPQYVYMTSLRLIHYLCRPVSYIFLTFSPVGTVREKCSSICSYQQWCGQFHWQPSSNNNTSNSLNGANTESIRVIRSRRTVVSGRYFNDIESIEFNGIITNYSGLDPQPQASV